jgi:pimeloyl-ACP methyl ester carboxylesterase
MSQWSDGRISANDIHIHYYRTGGEKPPLLLLHGFTDSGLCWTPVARVLAQDYDVIMPDARGHGLSDGPEKGFSTDLLVADAAAVIQTLGLKKTYVLGHSMGAHSAAVLASRHPELVRALLLEDPPWTRTIAPKPLAQDKLEILENERYTEMQALQARPFAQRLATIHTERPGWSEEEAHLLARANEQFKPAVFKLGLFEVARDWLVVVQQLTCPTLLITADTSLGALVTPETAELAVSTWQDGRVIRIAGAGHSIRRDQFNDYMTTVRQFLTEK